MQDYIMKSLSLMEINVQSCEYITKNNDNYYMITLVSRGNVCPECFTYSKKVHSYKNKRINHSMLLKEKLTVIYHQRRYICPKCGRTFVEENPFALTRSRISQSTIDKTLLLLKDYNETFSSVGRLVNLSPTEVVEIFDRYVRIDRKPLQEVICIDEFYFSRHAKNKYACMIIGFRNGLLLDVLKSRRKEYLKNYFRSIPLEERKQVKFISMDMYDNYRDIAHSYLPNALVCADSFHAVKQINEALNKIRLKVMHRYKDNKQSDEYYLLKHKNNLLFKDSLKINDSYYKYNNHFKYRLSEAALLEKMLNIDDELKKAYELKELYMIFNSSKGDLKEISKFLDDVIIAYKLSGIGPFAEIGETLSQWHEEVVNSFHTYHDRRISNGPIEGRNKYIKIILKLANGYRNFDRFRRRSMYVLNKYEKPLETPQKTDALKLPGETRGKYKKRKK
ncbi:MAG: ISL3 family transposase [Erysipelotrichaceae bacterium]|nr:ISL3 family transposase [Erysipelotrichaceae bacterium]